MAKNIEINIKTNDGYETLYPKVNGNNTELSSDILQKFGVESGSLSDILDKLSNSVGYKEDVFKISDIGSIWSGIEMSTNGSYGRQLIAVGDYIFRVTGYNVVGVNVKDLTTISSQNVAGNSTILHGIFQINDTSFGVWSQYKICITNDFMKSWETHNLSNVSLNDGSSICVYKGKMYLFGAGNSNEQCAVSADNSFDNFTTYNSPNGIFGMVACTDNFLMYTYGNYSDSRYRYYHYTTSSNPSGITGSDWGGGTAKISVYELFECNGYLWNPLGSTPKMRGYYIDIQGELQYKELDIGDASGTGVYGESITGITFDGTRYWISLSASKKEDGSGFSGLYSILEDGTSPVENNTLKTSAIIYNQNFLLRHTEDAYNDRYFSYSQSQQQINNYLINVFQEKLKFSGEIIFEYGTFIGTGKSGISNLSTLTFVKRPRWVVFPNNYSMIFSGMVNSGSSSPAADGGNSYCSYWWNNNTLSWGSVSGTEIQMSVLNQKYWYFALY